jgi:predicted porin
MQKKLIALAIAAAASSTAFAQTNVQIYGIADVGYVGVDADGGKFQHNINSGVLSTSRIGFKGAEDLGNGLKAIFTLEYGLLLDQNTGVGAGGAAARQQFVGLTGGFGTVVAGRLQTAGLDYTVAGSALGGSPAVGAVNQISSNNDFPLLNSASRANNAVAYISPSFGGLTLAVNHARVSEAAAATDEKDSSATLLAANYENGPISAGLVYGKADIEQGISKGDSTEWGVRAGYDFSVVKLQAAYQSAKLKENSPFGWTGETAKNKRWVLSATVPVTAKIGVIGEYAQAKLDQGTGNSDDKNKAYTLAATYSLSKRTTAYAAFVAVRPEANNSDVNIYGAGIRHAF